MEGSPDDCLKRVRAQKKEPQAGSRKPLPPQMNYLVHVVSLHDHQSQISNKINQTYQLEAKTYPSDSSMSSYENDKIGSDFFL